MFDGTEPGYPFLLHVSIAYTLNTEGFWMQVTAINKDPTGWPLPYYNGWHPYCEAARAAARGSPLPLCTEESPPMGYPKALLIRRNKSRNQHKSVG